MQRWLRQFLAPSKPKWQPPRLDWSSPPAVRSTAWVYRQARGRTPSVHHSRPRTVVVKIEAGDMVRLDIYGSVYGYLFDFGRSRVVGTSPTQEQQQLLAAVRDSVNAGTELLRPGQRLGWVADRCEEVFAESAYARQRGQPRHTMSGAWGHSLGLDWGPPWITRNSTLEIRPGMYFALERRIEAPGLGGAYYENKILVTEEGPEVVTPATDEYMA